jgi:hypothetical protein
MVMGGSATLIHDILKRFETKRPKRATHSKGYHKKSKGFVETVWGM